MVIVQSCCLCSNPYETSSAAAALQNDFKKRYKRAAKGLAAAVANFGCFALQWKSPLTAINSAIAAVQKIPELRSALQSGCKVASKRQGMLLPVMAYHSLVQKKRSADFNNTIITKHGRGVDKALGGVKTTRKSKCN